jgi:sec-independent protein translocase protein TatB
MLDFGFGELVLLAAIALVAIGPKQLPDVARSLGRFLNQLKQATGDFQKTLADAQGLTRGQLSDVQKTLEQVGTGISQQIQSVQAQAEAAIQPPKPATHLATNLAANLADESSSEPSPQLEMPMAANAEENSLNEPALNDESGDEHQQLSFDFGKKES